MIHLVADDCGRSFNKAVINGVREWFPSAVAPWRELKNDRVMGRNDMVVEYLGDLWFVGDVACDEASSGAQMMTQNKAHLDTKILTLTMLHRLLPNNATIFLMTGAPIEDRDELKKLALKKLFLGDHTITVNGEEKNMQIVRVEVAPECARAAWALRKPGIYTGVDIGSTTVNFATIKNGAWWDEKSGTIRYGTTSIDDISKSQFARMVMADLGKRLRIFYPMILLSGNANIYFDYIKEYNSDIEVHPDAFFANAQAFYELGVEALEKAKRA